MTRVARKQKSAVALASPQEEGKVIYPFIGGSAPSLARIKLVREKYAEIRVGNDKELIPVTPGLTDKQKAMVADFAVAVLGGDACIGAFAHRLLQSERVRNWRDQMPPEQTEEYRAKQAEWSRNWRSRMSPGEAAEYRAQQAERARERRSQTSPEEAIERRAKDAARKRLSRGSPSNG